MRTWPIAGAILLSGIFIAAAIAWQGMAPRFHGDVGNGTFAIVYPADREVHRCTMENSFDVVCTPLEFIGAKRQAIPRLNMEGELEMDQPEEGRETERPPAGQ